MHFTTRHLSSLATELTGKPTKVLLGHDLPMAIHGLAWHDGETFVIHLNPWLFKFRDAKTLGYVFRHECGHIARGHVPVQAKRVSREAIDKSTSESAKSGNLYPRIADRYREVIADKWEEAHRSTVTDAFIWKLVTSE